MEIKKSDKADLEGKRTERFLLGLIVALACLCVALEYTITPDDPLDDPDLLEMLSNDEDLSSLMRTEDELALAPKAEPKPTMKLVVKPDDQTQDNKPQTDEEPVETDLSSDMDAVDDEMEPPPPPDEEAVSFRVVEDLPQFPGGPVEFMKWLTRNLKYPANLQQAKKQGKVVAEFIVNKDGSVTDVKVVSSFHPACDHEVLRVLRTMPRWTAGIQDGKPCRTKVCIPVIFKL